MSSIIKNMEEGDAREPNRGGEAIVRGLDDAVVGELSETRFR